jgi:hypothetical protein
MPLSLQDKLQAAKEKALGKVGYKKGEPFKWRSTNRLDVKDKHPGWSYRWISEDSSWVCAKPPPQRQLVPLPQPISCVG